MKIKISKTKLKEHQKISSRRVDLKKEKTSLNLITTLIISSVHMSSRSIKQQLEVEFFMIFIE